MQTKVKWNKNILQEFEELAKLTDLQKDILHLYCEGNFKYIIAEKVHCCDKTLNRELKKLEKKYDELHKLYPEKFPDKYKYKTRYKDFRGYLLASNTSIKTKVINFDNKEFDSLEDARRFIIKSIESMSLEEFCDIGKVHIKLDLDFDIDVTKI